MTRLLCSVRKSCGRAEILRHILPIHSVIPGGFSRWNRLYEYEHARRQSLYGDHPGHGDGRPVHRLYIDRRQIRGLPTLEPANCSRRVASRWVVIIHLLEGVEVQSQCLACSSIDRRHIVRVDTDTSVPLEGGERWRRHVVVKRVANRHHRVNRVRPPASGTLGHINHRPRTILSPRGQRCQKRTRRPNAR